MNTRIGLRMGICGWCCMASLFALNVIAEPKAAYAQFFRTPARSHAMGPRDATHAYNPNGQAVADLDGDGDLDVVVAAWGGGRMYAIFFNNGDGSLGAPVHSTSSGATSDVIATDLDGDGDVDLAFSAYQGSAVYVFRNNGNATFGPPTTFTIGMWPEHMVSCDFDHDGDKDLATANGFGQSVSVLRNNGAASFTTSTIALSGSAFELTAGDINGDGFEDLVVAFNSGPSPEATLYNNGNGTFAAPVYWSIPGVFGLHGVAVADIDLDGDNDLIDSMKLMVNMGGGVFAPPVQLPPADSIYSGLVTITTGDVTGDGYPDLVGTEFADYTAGIIVVKSNGAGGFAESQRIYCGEYTRAADVADMNGDGMLDIVAINSSSNTIKVFFGEPGGPQMPPRGDIQSYTTQLTQMAVGDVDLDGDLDFVTGDSTSYRHLNNGDGSFATTSFTPMLGARQKYLLEDVNGDQYPDLLMIRADNAPPYNFFWSMNSGAGSFGTASTLVLPQSCGTRDMVLIDFDGDGDRDIAIADHLGCPSVPIPIKVHLVRNNGNGTFSYQGQIADNLTEDPLRLVAGDFDGDGIQDLVGGLSERVGFYRGNGNGTFASVITSPLASVTPTADGGPVYLTAADLNGDGILDLASSNYGDFVVGGTMTVATGNGNGTFTQSQIHHAFFSHFAGSAGPIEAMDVDADGDLDLIALNYHGSDLLVFANQGNANFAAPIGYGVNLSPFTLARGDFDADGIDDVAINGFTYGGGRLTILKGIGLQAGDIDGDGDIDLSDRQLFVSVLLGNDTDPLHQSRSDLNDDGATDGRDVGLFVAVLLGQ